MTINYLSVCSGIEAASIAWHPLGFKPMAFSEIEAFPSTLLANYYPDVPNLGDMEKHHEWRLSDIDVLVGGTPCQSFSVAGLRAGMADPRGNLALVYLAIADQFRPRWLVWENVPGVLSSNGGRDFGAFLGGLVELGYGFAYRVLDAQYFGVPQRRRRVFVVGYLGDWRRAAAVLFERKSLRRNPPPSCEAREDSSCALADSFRGEGVANTLTKRMHKGVNSLLDEGQTLIADPISANEGRTYTHEGKNNFRLHNVIAAPLAAGGNPNSNAPVRRKEDDVNIVACFDETQITHPENRPTADPGSAGLAKDARQPTIAYRLGVRRLTPRECERLQGFPDDYTLISYRGKPASDSVRYKALGNSMAVPVMRWIGERIAMVDLL